MKTNLEIESAIIDEIIEKPSKFTVKEQSFNLYPPTLGVIQLLRRLYRIIDSNVEFISRNTYEQVLMLCKEKTDLVCRVIAYSTFNDKESILNNTEVSKRAKFFEYNADIKDIAAIFFMILTKDETEDYIKYFGLDAVREKVKRISSIKGSGSAITLGGNSIYGSLIDFACQRYGWTMDYVVWGISYVNLKMLMADTLTTIYLTDEERKQLGMNAGEVIDADDPANNTLIRKMISE